MAWLQNTKGYPVVMTTNQVNIGEVILNGIVFDPKNSEVLRTMDLQKLIESVPRLFDLLEERHVDYVLVGGIAMLVYVEGRNTQVIDLIIATSALDQLPELMVEDRNIEFGRAKFGELQVDLLFTKNSLFNSVQKNHAALQHFFDRDITCATVDGLLLLKLFALPSLYRQGQFERIDLYERDVTVLLRQFQPKIEPIFVELAKHVSESDLGEIRAIVAEIEDRISRSTYRFKSSDD